MCPKSYVEITAQPCPNFKQSPIISQKYSPLQGIQVKKDSADFQFKQRFVHLEKYMLWPSKLTLYLPPNFNPPQQPPIVVISTNRAQYINTLLKNTEDYYIEDNIKGYNDCTIIQYYNNALFPWYAPQRSRRDLWIVVHGSEIGKYCNSLKDLRSYKDKRVQLAGWSIGNNSDTQIVGFGASRFAALELVKFLRCPRAWMVDDNVIQVNNFPPSLDRIEELMKSKFAKICGIGFKGATMSEKGWEKASFEPQEEITLVEAKEDDQLLQQVVLWNIEYLAKYKMNFNPCFICSNEDVSFTNYLKINKGFYPYTVSPALTVIKNITFLDDEGAKELEELRQKLLTVLFDLEKYDELIGLSINGTPFPQYIEDNFGPDVQLIASCCAREQIMAKIVALRYAKDFKLIFGPEQQTGSINVQNY